MYTDFTKLSSFLQDAGDQLMKDLAAFTFNLHQRGIYHMDYSNGNILAKKAADHYEFALIDNNRMKFGNFSYSRRLKNFRLLGLSQNQLAAVARAYARLENSDEEDAVQRVVQSERRHTERRNLRRHAKKFVLNRK
jgi:hypothetical protein